MMKSAVFLVVALGLSVLSSYAENTWSHIVDGGYEAQYGEFVIRAPGGGFLIVAHVLTGPDYEPVFIHVNNEGIINLKKTVRISASGYGNLSATRDGGYLLTTLFGLLKLNDSVDVQWYQSIPKAYTRANQAIESRQIPGYIAVGSDGDGDTNLFVTRLDREGNFRWRKVYRMNCEGLSGPKIAEQKGGFVVAVAGSCHSPGQQRELLLLKMNDTGEFLWRRIYRRTGQRFDGIDLQKASGGGFVILYTLSNGVEIVRFDSAGIIKWHSRVEGANEIRDIRRIQPTRDGGFILINRFSGIVKLDRDGNVEWVKAYRFGGTFTWLRSVAQTADGYLVAGSVSQTRPQILILKVDRNGNIPDVPCVQVTDVQPAVSKGALELLASLPLQIKNFGSNVTSRKATALDFPATIEACEVK